MAIEKNGCWMRHVPILILASGMISAAVASMSIWVHTSVNAMDVRIRNVELAQERIAAIIPEINQNIVALKATIKELQNNKTELQRGLDKLLILLEKEDKIIKQ